VRHIVHNGQIFLTLGRARQSNTLCESYNLMEWGMGMAMGNDMYSMYIPGVLHVTLSWVKKKVTSLSTCLLSGAFFVLLSF